MKKYIGIALALASVLTLGSCSKDEPFPNEWNDTGSIRKSSLGLEVLNEEFLVKSGENTPDVNSFMVDFIKDGESDPKVSYRYADMPEIITLPVGDYKVVATYGENASAAWEAPYFKGESETFKIKTDEITDNISPVVCKLSNIRVTILIDDALRNAIDSNASISVNVGNEGSLDFTLAEINENKSGYFAYVQNSNTLAATFNGKVEGYETHETKTYDNVAPGTHYRITFKLHSASSEDPGDIGLNMRVDASVESVNMNYSVDVDPPLLEDDMRPTQGGNDDPQPPVGQDGGPEITAKAPVNLDAVNDVVAGMECVLNVHSDAGIQTFDVYINSETLTKEVLEGVGLSTHLDMVNPGELEEGLVSLDLPVKDQVLGQHDVKFDISQFMDLLGIYGAANHEFKLVVKDANGTTTKTLKLRTL